MENHLPLVDLDALFPPTAGANEDVSTGVNRAIGCRPDVVVNLLAVDLVMEGHDDDVRLSSGVANVLVEPLQILFKGEGRKAEAVAQNELPPHEPVLGLGIFLPTNHRGPDEGLAMLAAALASGSLRLIPVELPADALQLTERFAVHGERRVIPQQVHARAGGEVWALI